MKFEKEITVEVNTTLDNLKIILKNKGFNLKETYDLNDIYMINKNDNNKDIDYLELLKKCVLIRHVIEEDNDIKILTYKYKEYNDKKEIIDQGKIDCYIDSIEKAEELFKSLNFEKLITIKDNMLVYANDTDEITIQCVNNKHLYIEIEEKCKYIEKIYVSLDEMKNVIKKYDIPIKNNNYFVKKAEIELQESLEKEI